MSERSKEFLFNLGFGGAAAVLVFILEMFRGRALLISLCNCLFVAAVLLLGVGGTKGVRNKGAFDVMGFGIKSAAETFIPALKRGEKETFLEYRDRKDMSRKSADGMLLAGAVYLALSALILIIYQIMK